MAPPPYGSWTARTTPSAESATQRQEALDVVRARLNVEQMVPLTADNEVDRDILDLCETIARDINYNGEVLNGGDVCWLMLGFTLVVQTKTCTLWKKHETLPDEVTLPNPFLFIHMQSGGGKTTIMGAFNNPAKNVIERLTKRRDEKELDLECEGDADCLGAMTPEESCDSRSAKTKKKQQDEARERPPVLSLFYGLTTSAGFHTTLAKGPGAYVATESAPLLNMICNPKGDGAELQQSLVLLFSGEKVEKRMKEDSWSIEHGLFKAVVMTQPYLVQDTEDSNPSYLQQGGFARWTHHALGNAILPVKNAPPTVRQPEQGEDPKTIPRIYDKPLLSQDDDDDDDEFSPKEKKQHGNIGGVEMLLQVAADIGDAYHAFCVKNGYSLRNGLAVIPITKGYMDSMDQFAQSYVNPVINFVQSNMDLSRKLPHVDQLCVESVQYALRRVVETVNKFAMADCLLGFAANAVRTVYYEGASFMGIPHDYDVRMLPYLEGYDYSNFMVRSSHASAQYGTGLHIVDTILARKFGVASASELFAMMQDELRPECVPGEGVVPAEASAVEKLVDQASDIPSGLTTSLAGLPDDLFAAYIHRIVYAKADADGNVQNSKPLGSLRINAELKSKIEHQWLNVSKDNTNVRVNAKLTKALVAILEQHGIASQLAGRYRLFKPASGAAPCASLASADNMIIDEGDEESTADESSKEALCEDFAKIKILKYLLHDTKTKVVDLLDAYKENYYDNGHHIADDAEAKCNDDGTAPAAQKPQRKKKNTAETTPNKGQRRTKPKNKTPPGEPSMDDAINLRAEFA